jgi:UDP-N-acetylglucosamine acyltransferase
MAISVAESARVDPRARLAQDVSIGPACVIGPEVEIGVGTRLIGHVCLTGPIQVGKCNTIGRFVAIGGDPQDVSYRGTETRVEIGDHNIIDERVTIHRGSEKEDGLTRIGNRNHFSTGVHIGHDGKLGDQITMGLGSILGGHVHVESGAIISGRVAVHQFVTIGEDSHIGAHSKITQDVPPFMRVVGRPPIVRSINGRKLKQKGMGGEALASLRELHRMIFVLKMPIAQAATILDDQDQLTLEALHVLKFLEAQHEGRLGRARNPR